MAEFIAASGYVGLLMACALFLFARYVNRRAGKEVLNPLLFSTVTCIIFLLTTGIPFEDYYIGAKYLDAFLTPTTICMAIPLYRQFELLKKNVPAVLAGCAAGVVTNTLCCLLMVALFRLDAAQFATLLPKSITTAIGIGVSEELGGIQSLTVVVIIITGVLGNIFAELICKIFRITDPIAQGVGIGTSTHAVGTARAMEMGEIQGAMSGLSIVVAGLMTVVVANLFAGFY